MSGRRLKLEPLSRDGFAAYGDVIEIDGARHFSINQGKIERYHDLARVEIDSEAGGRPVISIMTCNQATKLPCEVTVVERHPSGSQAFVPLGPGRLIIVVAAGTDDPQAEDFVGFVAGDGQGVNYRAGTWHMPLICEREEQRFLIIDRAGSGQNCDELSFAPGTLFVDG